MSKSGAAVEFMTSWGNGHNAPHTPDHGRWGADPCDACTAEQFDPWAALVHASMLAGWTQGEQQ